MTRKEKSVAGGCATPAGAKKRAPIVLERLAKRYPTLGRHLDAETPWQILVATVLAAQCTDARVNTVTPELFRRWPDPAALAKAGQDELEAVIRPTGFYRNKAKNLIAAAKMVVTEYGNEVPASMQELIRLPGVARKTANCVLWGGFGINEGLAVDTHVKRITYRLGLTNETDPDAIEQDLLKIFPREEWGGVNHRMVWFGRQVCEARTPLCTECELNDICPRCGVKNKT